MMNLNTDTIQAMLTPGEGVLNKKAMTLPGVKKFVRKKNKIGNKMAGHSIEEGKAGTTKAGGYAAGTDDVEPPTAPPAGMVPDRTNLAWSNNPAAQIAPVNPPIESHPAGWGQSSGGPGQMPVILPPNGPTNFQPDTPIPLPPNMQFTPMSQTGTSPFNTHPIRVTAPRFLGPPEQGEQQASRRDGGGWTPPSIGQLTNYASSVSGPWANQMRSWAAGGGVGARPPIPRYQRGGIVMPQMRLNAGNMQVGQPRRIPNFRRALKFGKR